MERVALCGERHVVPSPGACATGNLVRSPHSATRSISRTSSRTPGPLDHGVVQRFRTMPDNCSHSWPRAASFHPCLGIFFMAASLLLTPRSSDSGRTAATQINTLRTSPATQAAGAKRGSFLKSRPQEFLKNSTASAGPFLCAKNNPDMLAHGGGTIAYIGATSSVKGYAKSWPLHCNSRCVH